MPIKAYIEPVAVGDVLPDMPIFLAPDRYVPCPLETTCQASWDVFPEALKAPLVQPAASRIDPSNPGTSIPRPGKAFAHSLAQITRDSSESFLFTSAAANGTIVACLPHTTSALGDARCPGHS
jgi:hypothetical protein